LLLKQSTRAQEVGRPTQTGQVTLQIQTDMTGKLTADGEWLYRFIGIARDSDTQTDFVKDDRVTIAPAITWRPSKNTSWTILGLYQNDSTGSTIAFLPIEGTLYPAERAHPDQSLCQRSEFREISDQDRLGVEPVRAHVQ
jgi:hypothetical protein